MSQAEDGRLRGATVSPRSESEEFRHGGHEIPTPFDERPVAAILQANEPRARDAVVKLLSAFSRGDDVLSTVHDQCGDVDLPQPVPEIVRARLVLPRPSESVWGEAHPRKELLHRPREFRGFVDGVGTRCGELPSHLLFGGGIWSDRGLRGAARPGRTRRDEDEMGDAVRVRQRIRQGHGAPARVTNHDTTIETNGVRYTSRVAGRDLQGVFAGRFDRIGSSHAPRIEGDEREPELEGGESLRVHVRIDAPVHRHHQREWTFPAYPVENPPTVFADREVFLRLKGAHGLHRSSERTRVPRWSAVPARGRWPPSLSGPSELSREGPESRVCRDPRALPRNRSRPSGARQTPANLRRCTTPNQALRGSREGRDRVRAPSRSDGGRTSTSRCTAVRRSRPNILGTTPGRRWDSVGRPPIARP